MLFKKSAVALCAAGLVALAGPAMATGPYDVDVAGVGAGTYALTGTAKGSIQFVAHHNSSLVTMGCTGVSAAGTVTDGTALANDIIAEITNTTWTGCTGPLGIAMAVDQKPAGPTANPWDLVATGTATPAKTDVVTGYVDNVDATVRSTNPLLPCSFRVIGSADASFDEDSKATPGTGQDLQVNETSGNLVLTGVSGCFGLLADGDTADFVGAFNVSVPASSSPSWAINVDK